jgi:hypothetical protein
MKKGVYSFQIERTFGDITLGDLAGNFPNHLLYPLSNRIIVTPRSMTCNRFSE